MLALFLFFNNGTEHLKDRKKGHTIIIIFKIEKERVKPTFLQKHKYLKMITGIIKRKKKHYILQEEQTDLATHVKRDSCFYVKYTQVQLLDRRLLQKKSPLLSIHRMLSYI